MADPFTIDDASDGESRYGAYLLRRRWTFLDPDHDGSITSDPVEFAVEAFSAATPPSAVPGYVSWASPIAWGRCSRWDGSLRAYVRVMTRPIEPLMKLDGWVGWELDDNGLHEPSDERIAEFPAMCTSTLLLFTVPTDRLHVPQDAPDDLTVRDAKASVSRVVELLNERVRPVLDQLEGM